MCSSLGVVGGGGCNLGVPGNLCFMPWVDFFRPLHCPCSRQKNTVRIPKLFTYDSKISLNVKIRSDFSFVYFSAKHYNYPVLLFVGG